MKHCPYETNYNYSYGTDKIHNISYIKKDNAFTMILLKH